MRRRRFVQGAALLAAAAPALRGHAAWPEAARSGLAELQVVYLSPLKRNGEESRCHAEIWFVEHEGGIYLVTGADTWRARAVKSGLVRARIWVGDFGVWTDAKGAWKTAPMLEVTGSLVTDAAAQETVLGRMGEKYHSGWITWGPRFRNGLQSGTRVMLKYVPAAEGRAAS